MSYCNKTAIDQYLTNFTEPQAPVKAVTCAYSSDPGAGMGLGLFALFFFGAVGLALTIRVRHPAPLLVSGILTAGVVTLSLPGPGAQILAIVLFFGIGGLGLWLYARAQSAL